MHFRKEKFSENIDKLFDVFNENKQQRKKMEQNYKLRINEADWNFYHDQCGQRIGKCNLINEGYSQSDLRYVSRINQEILSNDERNQPCTSMSDVAIEVDHYSDSTLNSDSSAFSPPLAKQPSMQNRQNLTNLALMCERFDVPDRAGTAIASAV